ncbi:hypothetical protein DSO57_1017849 [Entomophthora muscae]|uniref:Uncharacterized protein n=1 Tax=Entomophthora muscae TaxID=34485 RepID=A0ACC2U2C4_9FUNG|nr:hypothetical protein DSO57_1017849 [Entomophthora muscae]
MYPSNDLEEMAIYEQDPLVTEEVADGCAKMTTSEYPAIVVGSPIFGPLIAIEPAKILVRHLSTQIVVGSIEAQVNEMGLLI